MALSLCLSRPVEGPLLLLLFSGVRLPQFSLVGTPEHESTGGIGSDERQLLCASWPTAVRVLNSW